MDALTVLHQRVSCPQLVEPAPTQHQMECIFRAVLRAADHGNLRPWRYLLIVESARKQLGELFVQAAASDSPGLSDAQKERIRAKPLRAPLIVVAIARCVDHSKVPEIEQIISTGAGVQNMLNAAYAMGIGAYWRTGSMAMHPQVTAGLGLEEGEKIVGFIYLGTPQGSLKPVPELRVSDYVETWSGKNI